MQAKARKKKKKTPSRACEPDADDDAVGDADEAQAVAIALQRGASLLAGETVGRCGHECEAGGMAKRRRRGGEEEARQRRKGVISSCASAALARFKCMRIIPGLAWPACTTGRRTVSGMASRMGRHLRAGHGMGWDDGGQRQMKASARPRQKAMARAGHPAAGPEQCAGTDDRTSSSHRGLALRTAVRGHRISTVCASSAAVSSVLPRFAPAKERASCARYVSVEARARQRLEDAHGAPRARRVSRRSVT